MIHQILLDLFTNSFFKIIMQLFIWIFQKLIRLPFNQVSFPVYKIWKAMASAAWTKFKKNFNNLPTKCCRNFILCISFSARKTTSNWQNVVTAVVRWWIYFWTGHFRTELHFPDIFLRINFLVLNSLADVWLVKMNFFQHSFHESF